MKRATVLLLSTCALVALARSGAAADAPVAADDWTGAPEQRIAGLATVWAEAKYAFPSFDRLPDLDWDRCFRDFVPRVLAAPDRDAYYLVLMEFAGLLEDGHTCVLPPWGYLRPEDDNPPLEVQVVDGAFLVARAADTPELKARGVSAGLEILAVDGVPVRSYFEESVNRYYPRGSAHANDALNIVYLLRGPRGSAVTLRVADEGGAARDVTLTRDSAQAGGSPFLPRVLQWMLADAPLEVRRLPGDIVYLRIAHFQDPALADGFLALLDAVEPGSATGLLIDLRFTLGGRSDIAERMIGALVEAPVSSPRWRYPHYVAARQNWGQPPEWTTTSQMIPPRDGRRFAGPVVILTAGTAASTAEDFAISLREAGRALLVGERTAGSAGNPLERPLPGGGTFQMATFRAYLPDGGEYVGLGLRPDVEARPTRESVRLGTDPVLEAGLAVLADRERWDRRR